jgi:hypothetical protein
MKALRFLSFVVLSFSIFSCGCSTASNSARSGSAMSESRAKSFSTSFKAYEMYSWQKNGKWYFTVIEATNDSKSPSDIMKRGDVAEGLDEALDMLEFVPKGADLYWNLRNMQGFQYPPYKMSTTIKSFCRRKGINLETIQWQ